MDRILLLSLNNLTEETNQIETNVLMASVALELRSGEDDSAFVKMVEDRLREKNAETKQLHKIRSQLGSMKDLRNRYICETADSYALTAADKWNTTTVSKHRGPIIRFVEVVVSPVFERCGERWPSLDTLSRLISDHKQKVLLGQKEFRYSKHLP